MDQQVCQCSFGGQVLRLEALSEMRGVIWKIIWNNCMEHLPVRHVVRYSSALEIMVYFWKAASAWLRLLQECTWEGGKVHSSIFVMLIMDNFVESQIKKSLMSFVYLAVTFKPFSHSPEVTSDWSTCYFSLHIKQTSKASWRTTGPPSFLDSNLARYTELAYQLTLLPTILCWTPNLSHER